MENNYWKQFVQSGRILHYLQYRQAGDAAPAASAPAAVKEENPYAADDAGPGAARDENGRE